MAQNYIKTDYLIIGSGIAGLSATIELSKAGKKSIIITKSKLTDSNTYYAQGGIAAVDPLREKLGQDTIKDHIKDTLLAGAGLCDKKVVEYFAEHAFETVKFLMQNGVEFSKNDSKDSKNTMCIAPSVVLDNTAMSNKSDKLLAAEATRSVQCTYPFILHQEGGHTKPRIYCVNDITGKAIIDALAEKVRQDKKITLLENHTAIDIVTKNKFAEKKEANDRCLGIYVLDNVARKIRIIEAKNTFLATGGAGRVFLYTSNPENATGDGIAMAYRAGAKVANMEFFQFHPTVLYTPHPLDLAEKRFLISESLRGKEVGGILTLTKESEEDFILKHDKSGSHGTRDIVARAIDTEMKRQGLRHVWLNVTSKLTGKSPEYLKSNFPRIYEYCLSKGFDITIDPIPVIPAAHYTCGGVMVNEFGETEIKGLYAIGEVACTGLMGANRLASNSLSEAALYGMRTIDHAIKQSEKNDSISTIPKWDYGPSKVEADPGTLNKFWDSIRNNMTSLCGIDRNEERLKVAVGIINGLKDAVDEVYRNRSPSHEIIELRNLSVVAQLITESALRRKESRGGHFRSDYPKRDDVNYGHPTILKIDINTKNLIFQ